MHQQVDELNGHHHGHSHGSINPSIITTKKGLWAVKWSFIGLMITFFFQVIIVIFTGSVALLADTIHNLGDAITAIPLGIAFILALKKPSQKFTYGYGRVEDLAGVIIVLIILFSAVVAGYQAINRIIYPQLIHNIWAVVVASIIGFIGNEIVAIFRIRVGKEIGSAALIADGHHARIDGFTSLAVLLGAIGVLLGFPLADPIIGLLITLAILKIAWDSIKTVFTRLLDGVEPEIFNEIQHSLSHVSGIKEIVNIKARWSGHQLYSEIFIKIDSQLGVIEAHDIIEEIEHEIMHHLKYISQVIVDIEPDIHQADN
ncbi:MAG: cation diffusion facilitator family transporter [Candidatus Komeilibacteria bacterium]|nr:cation diffusion facilitator family transporter [Candidatus Komeilibacteria bacterium]